MKTWTPFLFSLSGEISSTDWLYRLSCTLSCTGCIQGSVNYTSSFFFPSLPTKHVTPRVYNIIKIRCFFLSLSLFSTPLCSFFQCSTPRTTVWFLNRFEDSYHLHLLHHFKQFVTLRLRTLEKAFVVSTSASHWMPLIVVSTLKPLHHQRNGSFSRTVRLTVHPDDMSVVYIKVLKAAYFFSLFRRIS